ncbi:hypothetical protein F4780DRAFT_583970 [Xylariomycetidae sp. FL0641]|nr:hypothetical protein F4780DRAFT_583970 [Xylariomycetidae sp. FL0641]
MIIAKYQRIEQNTWLTEEHVRHAAPPSRTLERQDPARLGQPGQPDACRIGVNSTTRHARHLTWCLCRIGIPLLVSGAHGREISTPGNCIRRPIFTPTPNPADRGPRPAGSGRQRKRGPATESRACISRCGEWGRCSQDGDRVGWLVVWLPELAASLQRCLVCKVCIGRTYQDVIFYGTGLAMSTDCRLALSVLFFTPCFFSLFSFSGTHPFVSCSTTTTLCVPGFRPASLALEPFARIIHIRENMTACLRERSPRWV